MELTIKIKNKKMYDSFVQFFNSLGISIIASSRKQIQPDVAKKQLQNINNLPVTVAKKNADFKVLAGIWTNRSITLKELRKTAWGNRI